MTSFHIRQFSLLLLGAVALSACGGGADTEQLPQTLPPATVGYSGPAPAFPDVQTFRVELWENIRGGDRCGACHLESGQTPMFARSDDVNLAYAEALPLVDLEMPSDSRLVTKLAEGHNCWNGSSAAQIQSCVDIMTTWIEAWAGGAGSGGREIVLTAPAALVDPATSKVFPASSSGFAPIHQILRDNCAACHAPVSLTPQQPFFADPDINVAYEAAKPKIDLNDPANDTASPAATLDAATSRFVVRLRDEFHNCWTNCPDDALTMHTAIANFAGPIEPDSLDPNAVVNSKAMTLLDGIIASGGNRYETNQVALWEFKAGSGSTAFDTSGVDPAIDLTLSGDVEWVGGYGINIRDGKAQGLTSTSVKLYDSIIATGEYAIEAWVAPANVTQEEAFIVSYSGSDALRNFTLGQTLYSYDAYNRSSTTDDNGSPALTTAAADEDLQATLQHVVVNFDPVNGRQIYVNGVFTDDLDPSAGGDIGSWRSNFALVLGDETSNNRQWQGIIRLVAIHNRVLTPEQIVQNFDVGVGQKFFLLFYVGDHITDVPDPYVMFEVSQFDSYAYLFNEPRFISLDPTVTSPNVNIAGIRIGINGDLPEVGQAFQFVDTQAPDFNAPYTIDGQVLLPQGTIVPLMFGPAQDQFFLSFEQLGNSSNVITEPAPLVPGDPPDGDPVPDYGLRTFEEISATMATLTTVSPQEFNVATTYELVKQQLPTTEDLDTFLSAHQMGVAQLAIEYCNALVDDSTLRAAYWPGLTFPDTVQNTFGVAADRDLVLDPLVDRLVLPEAGVGLSEQPSVGEMKAELNDLTDRLTACYDPDTDTDNCAISRTTTVIKALCAAAIGNGAMLVH